MQLWHVLSSEDQVINLNLFGEGATRSDVDLPHCRGVNNSGGPLHPQIFKCRLMNTTSREKYKSKEKPLSV